MLSGEVTAIIQNIVRSALCYVVICDHLFKHIHTFLFAILYLSTELLRNVGNKALLSM